MVPAPVELRSRPHPSLSISEGLSSVEEAGQEGPTRTPPLPGLDRHIAAGTITPTIAIMDPLHEFGSLPDLQRGIVRDHIRPRSNTKAARDCRT